MSYCNALESFHGASRARHKDYHDHEYGFPITSDDELFGRLLLEINQAGLSWDIILKKKEHFRLAYSQFRVEEIASYTQADRERLLQDSGIVRNRLKINAAIENAKMILVIQKEYGSFEHWIRHHHPKTKAQWVSLFKKTFKFTGGEIVNEFLTSIGVLSGAHDEDCPIYQKALERNPLWCR